jgi:hypothetical protein
MGSRFGHCKLALRDRGELALPIGEAHRDGREAPPFGRLTATAQYGSVIPTAKEGAITTPTTLWSWLRRLIEELIGRESPAAPANSVEPLVRAVPASILLEEIYEYEQLVSRNPSGPDERSRHGIIEVVTPFDGYRHFGPMARSDAERALAQEPPTVDVTIGHLLLSNHRNATFPIEAGLDNQFGSLPLRIRLLDSNARFSFDSDSQQHRSRIEYQPPLDIPRIPPVDVTVTISDPDNTNLRGHLLRPADLSDEVADEISKYIAFEANLLLTIQATLTLPRASRKRSSFTATIKEVALDWPSITSLEPSVLRLTIGGEQREIQHNPRSRTLEWLNIPLEPSVDAVAPNLEQFTSPPMRLFIENPGELHEEDRLDCRLGIVVTNRLMSGIDSYAFDAQGRRLSNNPTLRTQINTIVTTELGEAFADRLLTTFQHVHFDEIVPRKIRIGDIKTTLHDLGFSLDGERQLTGTDQEIRHAIVSSRQEGPDRLHLLIVVRGLKHKTERQIERDGVRFTTELDSGELQLSVRGALPGDSEQVVAEINRLHLALREQFERVRDQR